jgi:hypothetical protein
LMALLVSQPPAEGNLPGEVTIGMACADIRAWRG